jgi:phenylpropionate dioxygenase-like ring-hydroxylating dioxygenase large terminal subunit
MAARMRADGHFSTAKVMNQWYIAARADELGRAPLGVTILDVPLVLFRDAEGRATALLDRCAHRNVPLSLGRVVRSQLECAYHGWRFDADGVCRSVPALCGEQEGKARRVPHYRVREQQGYVWIYVAADPDVEPANEPFRFPHTDDRRYATMAYDADFEATLHATAENILDVPHTAFLHRGLFRGTGKQNRISVVVRRTAERAEAEYIGEPRPAGVLGRLLAPGGGEVVHFDRFLMPSIAQVEYSLGASSHLVITNVLTPISDFTTRMFAMVALRLPAGAGLLKRVLTPFAMRVVKQDKQILGEQTRAVKRFGGEQYVSTPVDLLGPHILRLLKQAERGEKPIDELHEERLEMLA